jgi:hypothetical protein
MVALTERRLVKRRTGDLFTDPVKAAVDIFEGAMVVLDAGFAAPGRTAVGLKARGICSTSALNAGGAAGALNVNINAGIFALNNDGSVARTHIGGTAYIVDDQTVAATDGGGTRSPAGPIIDVNDDGVWVKF